MLIDTPIARAIDLACLAVDYRGCAALDPAGPEWFEGLAEAASVAAATALDWRHEAASHSLSAAISWSSAGVRGMP